MWASFVLLGRTMKRPAVVVHAVQVCRLVVEFFEKQVIGQRGFQSAESPVSAFGSAAPSRVNSSDNWIWAAAVTSGT